MKINKIYKIDELKNHIANLRQKKMIIGFTNGCFDLLHNGHLRLIKKSKKKCDFLIVAVNSDVSVKILKGEERPFENINLRLLNLSLLNEVDGLIVFKEQTPRNLINQLLPDIIFKGSDYKDKLVIGSQTVIKNGGKVEFIDLLNGYSTTIMSKKIKFEK
tara:strand:- start:2232 stop:2711 length:480 start_codon:yes stop_codon:yes gene_type:complete